MKYMLKFIFSLSLVCISLLGNAQTKDTAKVMYPERYGLRVGVDLHKIARSFYEKDYRGFEVVGDYRLSKRFYIAGEIGNEDKTVDDTKINFTTKGTYIKVGFDYNSYQNWLDMENIISVGLRYGVSSFSQTLNSYEIYDPNNKYFGEPPTVFPNEEYKGLSAQWVEVVAGVKVEVVNNIFVGFSFRLNRMVTQKQPSNFENLYIPGFNRTYNGDFGVGFNYTVSYFIPLYKSTVKTKAKAEEKAKASEKEKSKKKK